MTKSLITTLPLTEADLTVCVQCANETFETVIDRVEPSNVEAVRALWNAEHYVSTVLTEAMLPIERDYALSLVEAFLVHHVLGLVTDADTYETATRH